MPEALREDWLRLAERVLKGASFDRLRSRGADDLAIEPLYLAATVAGERPSRGALPWRIAQRVDHPSPAKANALALADLAGGVDELVLALTGTATARGFGVEASSPDALARTFDGIDLTMIRLRVETAPFDGRAIATRILDFLGGRGLDASTLCVDFGLDPVSDMARVGGLPLPWPALAERFAATAGMLMERGFCRTLARADGRAVHEAGATPAQELAAIAATGLGYLRAFAAHGIGLAEGRRALGFLLVCDADEFTTIAKFRALRRVWARIEAACGLKPAPIDIAAETAWRMMTRRDPNTNLLRATLAAFSAGVGGADSITILPFTSALGLPDAFARRVARNLQHVLADEAHLWRVADPAAGAGAFEALTDDLARKAWTLFQEIEAEGGIIASLTTGRLQARIAGAAERERADVARRKAAIIGVGEFAQLTEAQSPLAAPAPSQAFSASSAHPLAVISQALPSRRLAEPFERLRDRSDALLAVRGERPRVFLANLGGVASYSSRRMFARGLFESAGIEITENTEPERLPGIVEEFRGSGAPLVCLCSSDYVYADLGFVTARALKDAGARTIAVAGSPDRLAEGFREAGIDLYVHSGQDALAVLTDLYNNLFERSDQ